MGDTIALYIRLSLEDETSGESESITNQRELLRQYINEKEEFFNTAVLEFMDDGFSGTNFNRPGVKELLRQVGEGKIQCIIVKDFSRFGRNFVKVGDYIEQIFPFLGVRFIAVNNNFDSKDYIGKTGNLDVSFKNLLNDFYSKDISMKVKSSKNTKMQKGDYISSLPPYGYEKSKVNKNLLVIDPEAAKVVKYIFQLAQDGLTTTEIARELNRDYVPTPREYKKINGCNRKWNVIGESNIWQRSAVLRILNDERYTGKFVGGKREIKKVGSRRSVKVDKSDWIIVEDMHEAIISEELFMEVKSKISEKGKTNNNVVPAEYILKGKVFCGTCNHALRRKNSMSPYFFCETAKVTSGACYKGRIDEINLHMILLASIANSIQVSINLNNYLDEVKKKSQREIDKAEKEIAQSTQVLQKKLARKVSLYESYCNGDISKNDYLKEKTSLSNEITEIENKQKAALLTLDISKRKCYRNQFVDSFCKYIKTNELTREMVLDLVSKVKVFDEHTIEIVWNFTDDYERLCNLMLHEDLASK